jgi:uncharacterized repeat protein (TIGR02543 family)
MKRIVLTVFCMALFGFGFSACPNLHEDPAWYTITFNSEDGSTTAPITADGGAAVTKPDDPTRKGYVFSGWYSAASGGTLYTWPHTLTGDVTMYARWETARYTITFNTGEGGSVVEPVTVDAGTAVAKPNDPTREGCVFTGWYSAANGGTRYLWPHTLSGDIVMYAGWWADDDEYYVRADGNDQNDGLSETTPFKTLGRAIYVALRRNIRNITVLGTLNLESEGENSFYPNTVFTIINTAGTEITIRGKEGDETAALFGSGKEVISVFGNAQIRLEHLKITGGTGIQVGGQARVVLGEGALVQDNHSQSNGGGVYVTGGTFIVQGGIISGNTAKYGGGVYVGGGDFIMEEGEISGNTASTYGGGVYISDGTFTMSSGTINGNTASSGGGVCASNSAFTMSGGEISENTTSGRGSGVYVSGSGTFTMEDGRISGNTASFGGGVSVSSGMFTMSGGTINGNTASSSGGGVYISDNGAFTKTSGGTISDTNTAQNGKAAYVRISDGSFKKRDSAAGPDVNMDSEKSGSDGGWE